MAFHQGELVRPRSTGEILDDAVRLVLADAPVLLGLAGLFAMPAAAALLLALTMPAPESPLAQCLLPALVAATLPLTGLGAGACQEAFRCRAEGREPLPGVCLRGALRWGLRHLAVRAVVLALVFPCLAALLLPLSLLADRPGLLAFLELGLLLLLLPLAWVFLTATATAHPIVATGELGWSAALAASFREAQRNVSKTAVATCSRFLVLTLIFINGFLLLHAALWVADDLGGFDLTFPGFVMSMTNPAFVVALVLLGWIVLAPFTEAVQYLLHVDARARYEGLDLWYRAQRLMPAVPRNRIGTLLATLALALVCLSPARAEPRLDTVRAEVRQQLGQVVQQVQTTEPYAGPERLKGPLNRLATQLEGTGRPESYRWFREAVSRLPADRDAAVKQLQDLDGRLALVEENLAHRAQEGATPARSKSAIKNLLPPLDEPAPRPRPAPTQPKKTEKQTPDRAEEQRIPRERSGPGLVPPMAGPSLGPLLWVLVAGLLAAIVIVAARLWWLNYTPRAKKEPTRVEVQDASLEAIVTRPDQHSVESLWRQADEQARAGRFLEAVRMLYLAVLVLLHRSNLIRFERTRTNGEYLDQLRSRPILQQPFRGLTGIFDKKWYGERACQEGDYGACRGLAEELRQGVHAEK